MSSNVTSTTAEENLAEFLIAHAESMFTWEQLEQVDSKWTSDWMKANMQTIRAYARLGGYIIPWPSTDNGWRYVATTNDDTRRTGADLQYRHITTHLREELADYKVMQGIVKNQTPIDTRLLADLELAVKLIDVTITTRNRIDDAALVKRAPGTPARKTGPSITRHPKLFA